VEKQQWRHCGNEENAMSVGMILLIILILALLGAIPAWPYSRSWGYGPSGITGLVVLIVVVLLITGGL
jgi:fumarate reductase subunit D